VAPERQGHEERDVREDEEHQAECDPCAERDGLSRIRYLPSMDTDAVYVNDDFHAWVDGASIQIKAVTAHGDPVDFGTDEVREIIAALTELIRRIDGD
jgi:hypothetical protein